MVHMPQSLAAGHFLQRDNRFRVTVEIQRRAVAAHLPNSGRLGELLTPGRELRLAPMPGRHRKTPYDLKLVRYAGVWISVDARLPNPLFAEAFREGRLADFSMYTDLRREVRLGDSRIDFLLSGPTRCCWVETKSVTLVENGSALFPDAPTERGRRHLNELASAVGQGDRAAVVFVVQRPDARTFRPHQRADPDFAGALRQAVKAGVRAVAYRCLVSEQEIVLDDSIPVEGLDGGTYSFTDA
jgi:sugar fermentation stimulation protein A